MGIHACLLVAGSLLGIKNRFVVAKGERAGVAQCLKINSILLKILLEREFPSWRSRNEPD